MFKYHVFIALILLISCEGVEDTSIPTNWWDQEVESVNGSLRLSDSINIDLNYSFFDAGYTDRISTGEVTIIEGYSNDSIPPFYALGYSVVDVPELSRHNYINSPVSLADLLIQSQNLVISRIDENGQKSEYFYYDRSLVDSLWAPFSTYLELRDDKKYLNINIDGHLYVHETSKSIFEQDSTWLTPFEVEFEINFQ